MEQRAARVADADERQRAVLLLRSSSFGIAVYLGPPCDFGSASASSRLHDLQRATGFAATTCFQKGPCFGQTNWRRSIVVSADAVALSWRSWCVRLSVVSAAGATPAAATLSLIHI